LSGPSMSASSDLEDENDPTRVVAVKVARASRLSVFRVQNSQNQNKSRRSHHDHDHPKAVSANTACQNGNTLVPSA
jgi:hypothetical protein